MKSNFAISLRLLFIGIFILLMLGKPSVSTAASPMQVDSYASVFGKPQKHFTVYIDKNTDCIYGSTNCLYKNKYHTGVDSSSDSTIMVVGDGIVNLIPMPLCEKPSGCDDHGMGNVVIIEHTLLNGQKIYSLYAHLDSIDAELKDGECIHRGDPIGIMGRSGQGSLTHYKYAHLHIEFKAKAVLGDPKTSKNVLESNYWGYIPKKETDPYPDN